MKQIITCAIAGLGNRGNDIYGNYQFVSPEEMKVTALPNHRKKNAKQPEYDTVCRRTDAFRPRRKCWSSQNWPTSW